MILKFIHTKFELDISEVQLEIVEENLWFSETIFSKFSFPFELRIDEEKDEYFGMISQINSADIITVYDGQLFLGDDVHDAKLEIESIEGLNASIKIYYGFEKFPNFEKQLKSLPLEKINIPDSEYASIFDLAEDYINKQNVNFNFPKIIAPDNKFTDDERWDLFEGFINNYKDGSFVRNSFNSQENIQENKNIMVPMAKLLYVLTQGFLNAGYVLSGDVLTDDFLKNQFLIVENGFYSQTLSDTQNWQIDDSDVNTHGEFVVQNNPDPRQPKYHGRLVLDGLFFEITEPGIYLVAGNINEHSRHTGMQNKLYTEKKVLFSDYTYRLPSNGYFEVIDETINVRPEDVPFKINFYRSIYWNDRFEAEKELGIVVDLNISAIAKYNQEGELLPTLLNPKEIDLTQCVPEITFGEFVKAIRKLGNYDLKIKENQIIMNKITPQFLSDNKVDLRYTEIKYPLRHFSQNKQFLMKYADIDHEDYDLKQVLVSNSGYKLGHFENNPSYENIDINLIPLPQGQLNGVSTAHNFSDDNSLIKLAEMTPNGNKNETTTNSQLDIANIYLNNYEEWLNFRINARGLSWSFRDILENVLSLNVYDKIYAYNEERIITKITKKFITSDYGEVELETEA